MEKPLYSIFKPGREFPPSPAPLSESLMRGILEDIYGAEPNQAALAPQTAEVIDFPGAS
jgi:hypothetical protein